MRKDTEMMTGNILDQSQRNKIIKDNQACSSGESADCSAGDLEGISRRCRAAAGIRAWHQEGELQGAVCLEHETTEERTMELCYNSEVKQLCLLMCQMETRFCPHLTCSLKMQLLKSSECKQKLTILHTPLQNCCDVTKTKKRELEELSSPVAAGPDGPDHGNWLWNRFFLNSGNRKPLIPGGGLQLIASKHAGEVTVIRNTRNKLSFPPGHPIAVLKERILINAGFLVG